MQITKYFLSHIYFFGIGVCTGVSLFKNSDVFLNIISVSINPIFCKQVITRFYGV